MIIQFLFSVIYIVDVCIIFKNVFSFQVLVQLILLSILFYLLKVELQEPESNYKYYSIVDWDDCYHHVYTFYYFQLGADSNDTDWWCQISLGNLRSYKIWRHKNNLLYIQASLVGVVALARWKNWDEAVTNPK